MLPKVHGFEVSRMLKTSPSTRHIPVFMLTAAASIENKVQGFKLGANDYMTKPFAMPEFLARVESLLRAAPGREPSTSVASFRRHSCSLGWASGANMTVSKQNSNANVTDGG